MHLLNKDANYVNHKEKYLYTCYLIGLLIFEQTYNSCLRTFNFL